MNEFSTETERGPIDVVLVDDDRQWRKILGNEIEGEAEECDVTLAATAAEARELIAENDDVDCLVTDYRMPGTDGLELVSQVRERNPRLPLLLVTSHGSEDVAASAIDAGVDDYIIKGYGKERATQFVSKIRSAVDQYRLRQALEESEQRYRTVTEQSRDAIAMVRDGSLLFCNQRLVELTGTDKERLQETDLVTAIVHSDDRDQVRRVLDGWDETDDDPQIHETRVVQSDGTIRHCEYTGRRVDYDGETAILVSIRDVTERQRRERELQWERELNRAIHETLVESRTRDSLERKVSDQLQRHGYALAWVGEQVNGELAPRVVAGDRRYIETLDRTIESSEDASEPSICAARTGEAQFIQNFEALSSTRWRKAALDYHYRSGAGIPLVYNDIPYGVLAVYSDEVDRFDETQQRLLTDLADTVGFALHSLETQGALAADKTVETTVHVDDEYYLLDLARETEFGNCQNVRVMETVLLDDETVIQYLEIDGNSLSTLQDVIGGHSAVRNADVISEADPLRLKLTVTESVPEASLASRGMVVSSTSVEPTGATITIELPAKEDVRAVVSHLEDTFGTVSVQTVTESEYSTDVGRRRNLGTAELTEKQLSAVKAAYYDGFFERPRQSSASEVAESLGVTHSTFLRHLRAAQQKIFGAQFE